MKWTIYSWENRDSHPPNPGRYLLHRHVCDKLHFEHWNGNGWSSSNNEPLSWSQPRKTLKDPYAERFCNFATWLRDNYSTNKIQGEPMPLAKGLWRKDFTNDHYSVDALYLEYLKNN